MTRDGLPRAYLRLDPNIDQTHPDINGFVRLMCAAARQPERGRFRNLAQLQAIFGKHRTNQMIARSDVAEQPDGRFYVVGWDEWQEGDFTVAERMRRMRKRRSDGRVTAAPSPDRNVVTTDAGSTTKVEVVGSSTGVRVDDSPPPPVGKRANGTNPRALGTNPRAQGTSPRQERDQEKRSAMPVSVHEILRKAAGG